MSKPYLDVLTNNRKETFKKLAAFKRQGMLGGGTALSLQLKHRYSYDFDIFLPNSITSHFTRRVHALLPIKDKLVDSSDELTVTTSDNIKITFLYYYFPHLFPLVATESVSLFNTKDIAADKAATIGRRGNWRDYVDIFFLLKEKHTNLDKIIINASKKFGPQFSVKLFLEQLTFFEDIRDYQIDFIKEKISTEEIKSFLLEKVNDFKNVNLHT
ncbi:nucleotidyl transferase AbiEii/AbiGii toxin family protein [Patescibacteria group bacterium]|nr:nucleotidyl transferase AbiEii/AbiGii toxin family protein [Patescibacteria group bacterium]